MVFVTEESSQIVPFTAEAGLDATENTADDTTDSSGGVTTKNELAIVKP